MGSMLSEKFAQLIKEKITQKGWTLEETSEAVWGVKNRKSHVSQYVNAKRGDPNFQTIKSFGDALNIPEAEIKRLLAARNETIPTQNVLAVHDLEFDIRLKILLTKANNQEGQRDRYVLDGMTFEIAEAFAEVDDGEVLVDVRIGFDKARLTIRADDLKPSGNYFACETPEEPGEGVEPDYTGWFKVKFMGIEPLNWLMTSKTEGAVLNGRVDVRRKMAEISTREGAALAAELTVRREAMKVRIFSENSKVSGREITEAHRKRMSEVAIRRSIGRNTTEFLIHSEPLSVSAE